MNGLSVIAVTGTPGSGKTFFSEMIAKCCKCAEVIEINDVLNSSRAYTGIDAFGSKIADLAKLNRAVKHEVRKAEKRNCAVVLSGHLAAELSFNYDISFVIRAPLKALEKRFKTRKYPKAKISENLIAEGLDYCGETIRPKSKKIYELETQLQKRAALQMISYMCNKKASKAEHRKVLKKIEKLLPSYINRSDELYSMLKSGKIIQKSPF